jgi:hypothetical protein
VAERRTQGGGYQRNFKNRGYGTRTGNRTVFPFVLANVTATS